MLTPQPCFALDRAIVVDRVVGNSIVGRYVWDAHVTRSHLRSARCMVVWCVSR